MCKGATAFCIDFRAYEFLLFCKVRTSKYTTFIFSKDFLSNTAYYKEDKRWQLGSPAHLSFHIKFQRNATQERGTLFCILDLAHLKF